MAEEVDIVLRLLAAPDNKSVAEAMAEAIEDAQDRATKSAKKGAEDRGKAEGSVLDRVKALEKQWADERERLIKDSAAERAKAEQEWSDKHLKLVSEMAKREQELARKQAEAAEQKNKSADEAAQKYAEAMQVQDEANQKSVESGLKVLQGTMDLAEGAAILGLASEKDLEKFARGFVKIQAAFKMAKGGVDVIVGIAEGWRAVTRATQAATLAQNAYVAGSARATAAAAAAGTAAAGAGGVGGAAAAGGAAAGTTAFGATAAIAGQAALVVGAAVVLEEGLMAAGKSVGLVNETFLEAVFSWRSAVNDLNESNAVLEQKYAERRDRQMRDIQGQGDTTLDDLRRRQQMLAAGDMERAQADAEFYGKQRLSSLSDIDQRDARARDALSQSFGLQNDEERISKLNEWLNLQQQAIEQAKNTESFAQREVQAREQMLQIARQTLSAREQEVQTAKDLTQQLESQIEMEKRRQTSELARFGQLDSAAQDQLLSLAEKKKRGENLSEQDIQTLQQYGVGNEDVEKFYSQRGRERGGQSVVDQFLGGDALAELEEQRAKASEMVRKADEAAAAAREQVTQQTNRLKDSMGQLIDAVDMLARRLADFERNQSGSNERSVLDVNSGQNGSGGLPNYSQVAGDYQLF